MRKIVITCDSGINPYDMSYMIPDNIISITKDKNYHDTINISKDNIGVITGEEVLDILNDGEVFKTSSPTISDLQDMFYKYVKDGYDVIHISMSSGISEGSLNASHAASLNDDFIDHVTVIDSLTGGSGGVVLYKYAWDLVNKGLSYNEIVDEIYRVLERVKATFYISSTKGFVGSGRAPRTLKCMDALKLRYRVDINEKDTGMVEKGKLYPSKIYRGDINKTAFKYVNELINENNIEEYDPNYLGILKSKLEKIELERILEYIKSYKYFKEDNIMLGGFYAVISSYGVNDQLGIGLIRKK